VNRNLFYTDVNAGTDPTNLLREAYGQHFTFVFHHDRNECITHIE
jgi:hypothetical protein